FGRPRGIIAAWAGRLYPADISLVASHCCIWRYRKMGAVQANEAKLQAARGTAVSRRSSGDGAAAHCAGAKRATPFRLWAMCIGLATLAPVAFLALVETGLRVGGYGYRTEYFVRSENGSSWIANRKYACRFA